VFALGAGAAALALRVHQRDAASAQPEKAKGAARVAAVSYLDDVRSLRRARIGSFAAQAAAERGAASSHVALVLRASRGDSWISVRSASGRLLDERLLASGTQVRLHGAALWVRFGAPANVDLSANGSRARPLPSRAAVVVVTPRGMRVAEWAPAAASQLVASEVPATPAPATPHAAAAAPAPLPKPVKAVRPPAPPANVPERRGAGSSWPSPLPSP
jgi:hypothetical protein